jgi:predicted DNA-binding protein
MSEEKSPEAPTTVLNFRLSNDEIARLDRLAARTGITRAHFLRNLVVTGLDEVEVMESVGIVRAAITIRDIIGWMGDKAKKATVNLQKETGVKSKS